MTPIKLRYHLFLWYPKRLLNGHFIFSYQPPVSNLMVKKKLSFSPMKKVASLMVQKFEELRLKLICQKSGSDDGRKYKSFWLRRMISWHDNRMIVQYINWVNTYKMIVDSDRSPASETWSSNGTSWRHISDWSRQERTMNHDSRTRHDSQLLMGPGRNGQRLMIVGSDKSPIKNGPCVAKYKKNK